MQCRKTHNACLPTSSDAKYVQCTIGSFTEIFNVCIAVVVFASHWTLISFPLYADSSQIQLPKNKYIHLCARCSPLFQLPTAHVLRSYFVCLIIYYYRYIPVYGLCKCVCVCSCVRRVCQSQCDNITGIFAPDNAHTIKPPSSYIHTHTQLRVWCPLRRSRPRSSVLFSFLCHQMIYSYTDARDSC